MKKSVHFFNKLFCLLLFVSLTIVSKTQAATLSQGDLAVIGLNSLTDNVDIVALVNIPSGTVIKITDRGWDNNAFITSSNADGVITWTPTSMIPAGTIVRLFLGGSDETTTLTNVTTGASLTTNISVTVAYGIANPLPNNGDQIFIYQDADSSPFFIFGLNNSVNATVSPYWNTSISSTSNDSFLPNGTGSQNSLVNGTNAIGLRSGTPGPLQEDNVQYTGPTTAADKATWLSRLTNTSNWAGDDDGTATTNTINSVANPSITVGSANNAPTDIALSATSINENVAANSTVGALSSTDPDASNTFTYTLVTGTGDTDNASFNISGSDLRITSSPNFETKSSYTVRVRTTDQGSLNYEEAFTITINNVNETPTDIALSATSINENVAANSTVGTLSSTDVDASNTFTYTLVTGTGDTDNASFNISGSDLRITSSPNFETKSSYTVRVRTTDQGSLNYEEAFTITINNVNETPTDIALSATSINENVAANSTVGTLSSTDVDASNTFTYTLVTGTGDTDNASFNISGSDLRITSSPNFETKSSYTVRVRTTDQGSLTYDEAFTITINNVNETPTDIALSATSINENVAANSTVGALSSTDPDASNTFTYTLVTGTGDTDNASFNISGSDLRITSSPNFETKSSYTVRVRTTDQGSLNYEEAFTITINNVNETPTDIALSATSINENVAANSTVGALSSTDPDASNTFTYTLVTGTGDTDNASFNISGSDLRITSSPNFETKSSYTVRVRTTDQGSLNYEEAFTITINNVNETPTDIALSATSINENVAANSTVGTLSSTDPDASNTFTYTLVTGTGDTDNASFNISGSDLRITSSPNFETKSSYTVRVRTTDQGSLTYDEAFTITINNVNETPTDITLSATSINENVAANSTVGTLSSTDVDASNTFTYTLVTGTGDTDNASFNISGSDLRITSSPNFETKSSYTVRVRTTDQGSLNYEEAFTITINNVNETPTDIALSATSINENVAANSTVGALSSTDPDASNTFTYTLVTGTGDTDNASFNISGSDLRITSSPNFETKSSYTVRVRTTDQGSLNYEEAFTITINNVNETPTDIALSATSINENVAANSTVGTLSSTDVDASNTFTYTLVTGTGDTDNASFNISGSDLRITSSPNFETKSSYTVRVRTTDQGSLTYDEAFTITINNVNDAPTDITLSATSINENVAANTQIGTLSTTDPDASNTFTYTLSGAGADNSSFSISGNSLTINNSPNFESKSSYAITIRTTDQGSLTYDEAFTITINNVNDAPTVANAISDQNATEDSAFTFTFATNTFADVDASTTLTYTSQLNGGGALPSWLSFNSTNRTFSGTPLNANVGTISIDVIANDGSGGTVTDVFTITVANVNDAPTVANAIPDQNATEDSAFTFTFAINTFADVDASTTLTYTAQLNGGGALPSWLTFTAGTRTFSGTPLNANVGTISIDVIANDGSGGTVTDVFTITVANVNDAPTIANAIPDQNATEDLAFSFAFATNTFADADVSNILTYTAQLNGGGALPSWLSFNSTNRTFSGTPLNANVGTLSIDVIANDGSGGTVTDVFTITVANVNDAPTVANAISDQNATEDSAFNFVFAVNTFADVDASTTLTYTAQLNGGGALPNWLTFTAGTRTFSGTPLNANVGTISIDVIANDGSGGTVTDVFTITVANVNDAPTIANAIPDQNATEDVAFSFAFATNTFADADVSNTLTYTSQLNGGGALPSWLSFNSTNRTFSGTPLNANVGTISIDVIANDGSGGTVTDVFTITVANVNDAPTVANAISDQNATEDSAFNFVFAVNTFADVDASTTLTYTAQLNGGGALPSWLTFTAGTRTFSGTPLNANVGSLSIDVIANDGSGGTVTDVFTITVANVNDAPTDITLSATSINENVAANSPIGTFSTTDPDASNTFTYTLSGAGVDNSSFSISGNSLTINNSPNFESKSTYAITIRTTDQGSLTYDEAFTITINNVNDAPTVANAIPDQNATEDVAFSFAFATNTFADDDVSNTLTYTSQLNGGGALPSWLSFNSTNRTFSGTPLNTDIGAVSLDVIASDGNGGSVTDNFTITIGSTLPVSLNVYSAKLQSDGTVLLSWDTFSEQNNDYFEVSRSIDGQNFISIGQIKGKENSTQRQQYSFTDRSPMSGDNYYKLMQVDLDGKAVELGLRVVKLTLAEINTITIYPNPSTDIVNINFSSGNFQEAYLIDVNGKVLQRKSIGKDVDTLSFDLLDLSPSIYILKLNGNGKTISKQVIKK